MSQSALMVGGPIDGTWIVLDHDRPNHEVDTMKRPVSPYNDPLSVPPIIRHHYRRWSHNPTIFFHESIMEGYELIRLAEGYRR